MIKYYVNKDKRQVIGVIDGTQYDVLKKINKMVDNEKFAYYYNEKCLMPNSFKAVVTCSPDDEFDVEVGKHIAKKRIMERYYNSFDKRMEFFIKDISNMMKNSLKYQKHIDK